MIHPSRPLVVLIGPWKVPFNFRFHLLKSLKMVKHSVHRLNVGIVCYPSQNRYENANSPLHDAVGGILRNREIKLE